ncbi:putative PRKR-interacting protein [Dioscorea sansibarensis]
MSTPSRESGAGGEGSVGDLMLVAAGVSSQKTGDKAGALVEYGKGGGGGVLMREDEEDLEVKLRRIIDNVPVRVSNTSGSSAGSGSGDFHQYRQMRRKEQDRLARMDVDYQRRKQLAEFNLRREERLKASEERTAKKRLKRQKKKQKRKEKKSKTDTGSEEQHNDKNNSEDDENDDDDDDDELKQ